VIAISRAIEEVNGQVAHERHVRLRFALHYGEVDAVEGDREGPEVSFTFRLEGIGAKAFGQALTRPRIRQADFPLYDYALVSQTVINILLERHFLPLWEYVSVFPLKGFPDYYALYLIRDLSTRQLTHAN
jgi:class 3 adenylate cyclase